MWGCSRRWRKIAAFRCQTRRSTPGSPPSRTWSKGCCRATRFCFPAVASGALEPEIEIVLEHAGLRRHFAAIASASDGVRGKPAPDLYLLAMAKLKDRLPDALDPGACIAIEDSHWGLEAAHRAGLRSVAVTHTYPAAELGQAHLVVDTLSDLTLSKIEELMREDPR